MRLIDPGPGEFLDRLTILELKIAEAAGRGVHYPHFLAEFQLVRARLFGAEGWGVDERSAAAREWHRQLNALNARIWHLVDELLAGSCRDDCPGKEAQLLNIQRATLIGEINTACGLASGPEKLS